jgi:cell division protein FtsQ
VWDNPRLVNVAASVLAALALGLFGYAGGRVLLDSPAFLLRTIVVEGSLERVQSHEIVNALQGHLSGTFFTVDLEAVRALFEGIPWVRHAELRRRWPDCLEVRIEEQVALARWGQRRETQLVNAQGELFRGQTDVSLPVLAGPAGTEGEVARRYVAFRDLLAPLGLEPKQVLLSSRLAWQLKLSNGLTIQLGRDSDKDRVEERLARFASAFPQTLAKSRQRLEYVDLRYPNGFALRISTIPGAEPPKPAHKRV